MPSGPPRKGTGPLDLGAPFGTRYRILRELGAGGMGVVYQAWDAELGVAVALKVVRPEVSNDPGISQEVTRRFKRELLLARQVTHKNVVRIHDLGEIDGIKYITMPYIEGRDLAGVLRERGQLPAPEALRIGKQIAAGLVAAHDAGVVHRDLKPENIMIDADGQALIMDFGISRSATTGSATMTAAGAIVGTLEYMAPEQATGVAVDHRADIYALGLILHDMLAGRRRITTGSNALSEMMARMRQQPPPLRTIAQDVPEPLERIVTTCLQPIADQRYATSRELLNALEALDPDGHAARKPISRDYQWKTATATMLVLLLLAAGTAVWFARRNVAPAAPPAPRAPLAVLIADFRNDTGQSVFQGSLEQALGIAMEGASFITAYPRSDAQQIAQRQNIGATLTEPVATLVALQEGINVLLVGAIASSGNGYKLIIRAVNPREAGKPAETIESWEAQAASATDVLAALTDLAGKARVKLGDTTSDDARRAFSETVTARSLEAIREYSQAQELSLRGKDAEAIPHYQRAIALDAKFGRAYAGWAVSAHSLGQREVEQEQWKKALELTGAMTEREKYRTLGAYFLSAVQDYEKAAENFRTLVEKYPADMAGHANLALAYFFLLKFPQALEEGRRAVELNPKSVRFVTNYALYAMYASDFKAAREQSQQLIAQNPGFYLPYFTLAAAQIMQGKADDARTTYTKMAGTGAAGASLAAMGLADLALYEGRPADAEPILKRGIDGDRASGATASATTKVLALAEAKLALGRASVAAADAAAAAATQKTPDVLLPAARILIAAGREADAAAIAADLEQQLQPQSRAYGKIIRGDIALANKRFSEAVQQYRSAKDLRDIWAARFGLGVAYIESGATGAFALASTELEDCLKRRGEATALFLDEVPTFRYLAPLQYWLGRAKEGLNRTDAAADYRAFLALRPADSRDPLAADARRRLQQ
jgi:tetratricopeptide (TPR) repeat protein/tRNA A-37 threonylcarbamoyl transferase component Bud32